MRKIIHVDMDCFYAAVEVKFRPELKGKPLGVGGPATGRGVLTTASYEARKFGVRSAMSSAQAVRLCPELILIPPHFGLYKNESRKVREIFERFTNKIEPLSLDEAFLDVTDSPHFGGSATLIAQEIRRLIKTELNLTASAGVAPNKFLAKVASDWKKPDGLFVIRPQEVMNFVKDLPVEKIHGVGKVTAKKMHGLGLKTCGDIRRCSILQLHEWFGSWAQRLHELAHGEDHREVQTEWERKSLSVEETYHQDLQSLEACLTELPYLYEEFHRRLEKGDYQSRVRGFVVKLKFHDFKTTTHEEVIEGVPAPEDFARLLEKAWLRRGAPVRLIGIGVRLETEKKASSRKDVLQMKFAI